MPAQGNTMEKISITGHAILVGAGSVEKSQFDSVYDETQYLVGVDGGANYLRDWGYTPDLVIGDFDSIKDPKNFQINSEVRHIKEQDSTDLEKALHNIDAPVYIGLGFTGDRLDHTFELLHILSKYDKKMFFLSEKDFIFRLPTTWHITLPIGTRVSLYPFTEVELISSEGLKYPLHNLRMSLGKMIGTSNETTSEKVTIHQKTSGLLGILPNEFFNTTLHGF